MARFGRFRKSKSLPARECSKELTKTLSPSDIPREKAAPLQIGPFRLDKNLGIGSFGKVKLATHISSGEKVAIKVIAKKKVAELKMHDKVQREINILQPLRHENIMWLHCVIDTPTDIFLVNEFVSGGELFDYMVAKGRSKPEEARWFFHQIMSGVEYCHLHRVVHRDLKPENILMDSRLHIKLADFGLSNILRDGEFLRSSCGSPNYAAPEVIRGHFYAGPEVDVWSCGVVLYALLCGSLPFDDEEIPKLFRKIKSGQFRYPNHMSDSAKKLISGMLNVDPMERIGIAEIKQHEWFLGEKRSPPQTHGGGASQMTKRECSPVKTRGDPAATDPSRPIESSDSQKENRDSLHPTSEDPNLRKKMGRLGLGCVTCGFKKGSPNDEVKQESAVLHTSCLSSSDSPLAFQPKSLDGIDESSSEPTQVSFLPGNFFAPQAGDKEYHHRKWYAGLQSRKPPAQIMTQVYKALMASNCQWFQISPYCVKCRWIENDRTVKLVLRLYKEQQHLYVLDFQQVVGNPILFATLCSNIIYNLKSSSQRKAKNKKQTKEDLSSRQQISAVAPGSTPPHTTLPPITQAAALANNRQE